MTRTAINIEIVIILSHASSVVLIGKTLFNDSIEKYFCKTLSRDKASFTFIVILPLSHIITTKKKVN